MKKCSKEISKSNSPQKKKKIPWNLFCVGHLLSSWGMSWSVVYMTSDTPLEKTNFPFVSRYQSQITSWLKVGAHVHFPLSLLGPCLAGTFAGPLRAATVSMSSCASVLLCPKERQFPQSHRYLSFFRSFSLLFCLDL